MICQQIFPILALLIFLSKVRLKSASKNRPFPHIFVWFFVFDPVSRRSSSSASSSSVLLRVLLSFNHHLSTTIFHTHLCHTPSVTHTSVTHIFVNHHLSTTICHTHLCHTHLCQLPSFTHIFVNHHLSHTSLSGVALGDIHLRFTWQAWHAVTSICVLRGRRGT